MYSRLRSTAFFAASALAPLMAFAADDAHAAGDKHEAIATFNQGVATAITALVVFAVVFAVLATKVWPVIVKGLDERANKIKEEIESAEMARQQAKDALEQYQQSLAQARAEAQKMLEATKAQQAALAAELKAKADAELGQMRERAMKDIEVAKRAAISEIYNEAASLATAAASKILRREIRPGDQQGLVEESLAQLQASRN